MGKLIRDISRESDCRKENTNSTQNQPNELGPKILGDMIQSKKAVVDKKHNEVSYEQPKRINRYINSEPHSFADTRIKKTLNRTDMRQQANDRNREELIITFFGWKASRNTRQRESNKKDSKINNMQH